MTRFRKRFTQEMLLEINEMINQVAQADAQKTSSETEDDRGDDGKKPRSDRKRARKDYLKFAFCKKRTTEMIRATLKLQLQYVRRKIELIEKIEPRLSDAQKCKLTTTKTIYLQQKEMFDQNKHRIADRIVSLYQPWVRPIKRGKAQKNGIWLQN